MKLKAYSIRDMKADAFSSPFFVHSEVVAKRLLTEMVQDRSSDLGKYPADFAMFCIGGYDNETAAMSSCVPELVCSAVSCLPKPDPRQLTLPVPTPSEEVVA